MVNSHCDTLSTISCFMVVAVHFHFGYIALFVFHHSFTFYHFPFGSKKMVPWSHANAVPFPSMAFYLYLLLLYKLIFLTKRSNFPFSRTPISESLSCLLSPFSYTFLYILHSSSMLPIHLQFPKGIHIGN